MYPFLNFVNQLHFGWVPTEQNCFLVVFFFHIPCSENGLDFVQEVAETLICSHWDSLNCQIKYCAVLAHQSVLAHHALGLAGKQKENVILPSISQDYRGVRGLKLETNSDTATFNSSFSFPSAVFICSMTLPECTT